MKSVYHCPGCMHVFEAGATGPGSKVTCPQCHVVTCAQWARLEPDEVAMWQPRRAPSVPSVQPAVLADEKLRR